MLNFSLPAFLNNNYFSVLKGFLIFILYHQSRF